MVRNFISCMSTRTQALRSLLKKGLSFQWTEETAREFQDLILNCELYPEQAAHTTKQSQTCM